MLLYKLDDALRKIEEALHKNDKELADIYVKRYLNCKNSRFAKRVDRVCQLIQELKALHDARREEAERLRELATRDWSNLCDLKQSLCQVIKHDLHLECYETEHFHLTVRPCSDELRITWPQAPLIQELKARHDARREEAERLRELATRDWSNLCDLKQSLCQVIKHDLHLECYETEHFHLTVRPCSDRPRITWPQAPWEWPAEFVIERDGQKELDIAALRQALLEGREIEGCAILPLQYELVIE